MYNIQNCDHELGYTYNTICLAQKINTLHAQVNKKFVAKTLQELHMYKWLAYFKAKSFLYSVEAKKWFLSFHV